VQRQGRERLSREGLVQKIEVFTFTSLAVDARAINGWHRLPSAPSLNNIFAAGASAQVLATKNWLKK